MPETIIAIDMLSVCHSKEMPFVYGIRGGVNLFGNEQFLHSITLFNFSKDEKLNCE